MATTINHPYQITTLTAKGSAEVIARGILNDYITTWSENTNTIGDWDRIEDFPTVVRTGNFVWCWYREFQNRGIYVLIDVVPDPEVEYQLGNNIAYPALLNGSVGEIENAIVPASLDDNILVSDAKDLTDGPYYNLAVENKYNHIASAIASYKSGFWDANRSYKDIVADKWGRTPDVWGGFATSNSAYTPWIVGWGGLQNLLTSDSPPVSDGDAIAGIFAPFATYEQFQTLYGAESDWIHSTQDNTYKTLFGPTFAPNGAGVQYTTPSDIEGDYPFTVEDLQPQTKYKDIAGDTNQDGIDDSVSFDDALAALGTAAATFPGLDITKCGNLADLSIKLPGIDLPSINELKNKVKASVDAAVSSTGLLELEEKLEGFKDGLKDLLPEIPQIENLALDIMALKDFSEDTLNALKEKWEDTVDDIESIIDNVRNLGGFDICEFVTDKAKPGPDGTLVKKIDPPTVPEIDIEPLERGITVPQSYANFPQDEVQQSTGITESVLRVARVDYNKAWNSILSDPFIQKEGGYAQKANTLARMETILKSPQYQQFKADPNNQQNKVHSIQINATAVTEQEIFKDAYRIEYIDILLASARKQIDHKLFKSNIITTEINAEEQWRPPAYLNNGSAYPNSVTAIVSEDEIDFFKKLIDRVNTLITKDILNEEVIETIDTIASGTISSVSARITNIQSASDKDNEGDSVHDQVAGQPTVSEDPAGRVTYVKGYKYKVRNKPIQGELRSIMEKVAAEGDYKFIITSGGQDPATKRNARRTGSKRHDFGYAADVIVKNKNGRKIGAAGTSRDISELKECIRLLLKNGIGAVGADDDYMDGNIHIDIAYKGPYKLSKTCWGAKGKSYRRIHAPAWLIDVFDNR